MSITQPGPDRDQLGFSEAVKLSFAFAKDYGLEIVQEEVTLVRYQSERVILSVYHGGASYELGIQLQRVGFARDNFGLNDVTRWVKSSEKTNETPAVGQSSSRESVQELVPRMADFLEKHAVPLLRGDASAYQEIEEQQSADAAEFTNDVILRGIRREVEAAWHAKDYAQVVALYGPLRRNLPGVEAKKLAYAERQLHCEGEPSERRKAP